MSGRYTRRQLEGGGLADILISWALRRNKQMKTERFRNNAHAARVAKQDERRAARSTDRSEANRTMRNIGSFLQQHENAAEVSLERRRREKEQEDRRRAIAARDEAIIKQIAEQIELIEKAYGKVNDIQINTNAAPNSQLEYLTAQLNGYKLIKPNDILTNIRRLRDQLSDVEYKRTANLVIAQLEQEISAVRKRYNDLIEAKNKLAQAKHAREAQEALEARRRQQSTERKVKAAEAASAKASASASIAVAAVAAAPAAAPEKSGLEKALELQAARNRERQQQRERASAEQAQIAAERKAAEEARREEAAARKESANRKESAARARKESADRKESAARKEASAARTKKLQSNYKTAAKLAALTATSKAANLETLKSSITSLIEITEQADSEKQTYDGHRSIMLKNQFVQNVILKLLSNIHHELYVSKLDEIKAGLNAETTSKFTNEVDIKKHLYRFFVKGGAASTFLFRERSPRIFPLTNDIDCVLLINPQLESKEYKQLQVNLMKCIVKIVEDFITKTILPSHMAVENERITPQIYKYYNDLFPAYNGPLPSEETRLPKLLDRYATELQTSPFPSLYSKNMEAAREANAATELQRIFMEKQPLQTRFSELVVKAQQLHMILAQNQQLELQVQKMHEHERSMMYYPGYATQLQQLRYQKAALLQQMLRPDALQQMQHSIAANQQEQYQLQQRIIPLQTSYNTIEARMMPAANLQRLKDDINTFYERYKLKTFTYNVIFNAGYIKDNALHLFQQSIISVRPKIVNKKYELFDIIIPFKKNAHLREEWAKYTTQEFKDIIPEMAKDVIDVLYDINHTRKTPIRFDIETAEAALLDQIYAVKGTPETLADKLANRKRRLKYLTAKLIDKRCKNEPLFANCVKSVRSEFPDAFRELAGDLPASYKGGSRSNSSMTRKLPRWFHARKN
jgi:hypothetical protein